MSEPGPERRQHRKHIVVLDGLGQRGPEHMRAIVLTKAMVATVKAVYIGGRLHEAAPGSIIGIIYLALQQEPRIGRWGRREIEHALFYLEIQKMIQLPKADPGQLITI